MKTGTHAKSLNLRLSNEKFFHQFRDSQIFRLVGVSQLTILTVFNLARKWLVSVTQRAGRAFQLSRLLINPADFALGHQVGRRGG